jgi:hypothetical protein
MGDQDMLTNRLAVGAAALLAATPIAAAERATDFVLVNGTGTGMRALSIRRYETGTWQALSVAPGAGERRVVQFKDDECAFDIQATLGRDIVVWSGANLCQANAVILMRDASGRGWVDYD